jgi:chaperonin GroES
LVIRKTMPQRRINRGCIIGYHHHHHHHRRRRVAAASSSQLLLVLLCVVVLSWSPTTIPVVQALSFRSSTQKYQGGAGVGRFVLDSRDDDPRDWQCHFDMILVERIQGRPPTDSGLYVPSDDLPKLHLCRVLAMGPGEELENGTRRAMPVLKVGDVVIAKNPWGIGPKDEETVDGGKLSFMRSQDIAAVITGGIVPDVE